MEETEEFFKFPKSKQGLEWFRTIDDMKAAYHKQYQKLYGQNVNIKQFQVTVQHYNRFSPTIKKYNQKLNKKMIAMWKIKCDVCSNTIVYSREEGQEGYSLAFINYYHIHTNNRDKYLQFLSKQSSQFTILTRKLYEQRYSRDENSIQGGSEAHLLQFLASLPIELKHRTRFKVMHNNFGISQSYFHYLTSKLRKQEEISFQQLIDQFNQKNYSYSFLPTNLLDYERSNPTINKKEEHPEEKLDPFNPELPNIFILVTPEMRQQYQKFGELVGFDLTFSVIRERSEKQKEYMIGVFAGTNESKRIVIFGLTVTNSQTVFAYSFIFKEFFRLVGGEPKTIITDEQSSIYYALRKLQKEKIFSGKHLLDMFHILRKYRRGRYQNFTFQMIRKLMHARDRFQYRRYFREARAGIENDKELALLRNFDLNSQKYTYSQIDPSYVGIGISNSPNEHFHFLIKIHIPYAVKYTKAIQQILVVIEKRRIMGRIPSLIKVPYQKLFNLDFMEPLKNTVSERAYQYIMREIKKCPFQKILSQKEVFDQNLKKKSAIDSDSYYVKGENGFYLVYKQTKKNKQFSQKNDHNQWRCSCELQKKGGFPCSHIAKVLLAHNINIGEHLNQRWKANLQFLEKEQTSKEIGNLKMNRYFERKIYLGKQLLDGQSGKEQSTLPKSEKTEWDINATPFSHRWSKSEQIRYAKFLRLNKHLFLYGNKKNQKQLFKLMSMYIESKNSIQCFRHHFHNMKNHNHIDSIINKLLPKQESQTNSHFMDDETSYMEADLSENPPNSQEQLKFPLLSQQSLDLSFEGDYPQI